MAEVEDRRKERRREWMRAWRAANPGEHVKRVGKWRENNPMQCSFWDHKSAAKRRNIPFLFTFDEWREIWIARGKWEQRGNAADQYCMARLGDSGPYAVGNVRICTQRENNEEQANIQRGVPVNDKQRDALAIGRKARWAGGRAVSDAKVRAARDG